MLRSLFCDQDLINFFNTYIIFLDCLAKQVIFCLVINMISV